MGEASCPKATIVVPVYNSARSIQRCLDSLLVQSECSIQVVCVNDGSTDDSLNVLRQIAQADDRVLVIDQKNEGVSCARNARGRRNELVGNTSNGALSRHIRPLRSQKRREVHVDASRHAMEVIGIQARQVEHN